MNDIVNACPWFNLSGLLNYIKVKDSRRNKETLFYFMSDNLPITTTLKKKNQTENSK